ncbi:MAG: MBL fold metallo-hydrolase [Oscillospiraceae bacterium]|nr:MBL fold metallo-hydrolase [Oscillospiraceae bacterium]
MKFGYKVITALLILSLLLSSCGGDSAFFTRPELDGFSRGAVTGSFETIVYSIAKADAILLMTENHTVIIDAGDVNNSGPMMDYLLAAGRQTVDCLIITHFHKDHVGGAAKLFDFLEIRQVVVPDYTVDTEFYAAFKQQLDAAPEIPVTVLGGGADLDFFFDDVQFNVTSSKKGIEDMTEKGENNMSLVTTAWHGDKTFLYPGDVMASRIAEMIRRSDLAADYLKFPHHGAADTGNKPLLDAVNPEYTVVTDSNKWPIDDEFNTILDAAEGQWYSTRDGVVYCVSDGQKLSIWQE